MDKAYIDEYFTKDLGEAAGLICSSVQLLRLQKESKFFWFIFANKSVCEQLANDYWSGGLKLDARRYSEVLRSLKDRLFSQK